MARALIACAALVAAFSLASCKRDGAAKDGADTGEVTFQLFGDPSEVDGYRALVAELERAHPKVKVRLLPIGKQKDHMAKLATGFSGGNPPDVFLVNYRRYGQLAERGVLEPLGARMAELGLSPEAFYPESLEAFRWKDQLLCLPQNASSLVVYLNKKLFADKGVPLPRAGWTWEDFRAAAIALTDAAGPDPTRHVDGVGIEPTLARLAPFVWQAGGDVVDDLQRPTRLTLSSPRSVLGLKFVLSLRRVDKVTPPLQAAKAEDLESRFARGKLGMLFHSRRFTPTLRAVQDLDWDVAPLPVGAAEATLLHSDAYCVPRESRAKAAALKLVGFALSQRGAELIARSGRTVPSLRAVAEGPAFLDPSSRPASARVFLDAIPHMRRLPSTATWHEIETRADVIAEEWYYGPDVTPWGLAGPPVDDGGIPLFPGNLGSAVARGDELTILEKEIHEATRGLWFVRGR